MSFEPIVSFSVGLAGVQQGTYAVHGEPAPRVQYSAVTSSETRLPEGMQPMSLLENRTGRLLVGDSILRRRSDAERTVDASLNYIQRVAGALPINEEDERMVDALVAKRIAGLKTRPLRRREGDDR
jgi:hypothetical protein